MTAPLEKYDYNVYVSYGEIGLYAYKQEIVKPNHFQTKTDDYTSIRFPLTEAHAEEIMCLLNLEDWADYLSDSPWDEYDDWLSADELLKRQPPAIIKSYLDHLPDYEMETVK